MEPERFYHAVLNGINQEFVQAAEAFGKELGDISSSQIRKVFSRIKSMEQQFMTEESFRQNFQLEKLLLLQPQLDYATVRTRHEGGMKQLAEVLSAGIQAVESVDSPEEQYQAFKRFANGFEAILAYHKVHQ